MKFKPQISRRGKHFFAEIALARGPRQMAVTGSGSFGELFGYAWMAILDRGERRLRLFQLQVAGTPWAIGTDPAGAEWVEVSVPALPHDTKELRHLGLAFDQSARHVVAYERAGEVWVRQWDPGSGQYVMRGPWPGVDPVLVMDAEANGYVPDSDVLLFHLALDREHVLMRAQRDGYDVEYQVEDLGEAGYLDQGFMASMRAHVVGSLASAPTTTGFTASSSLYPVRQALKLALDPQFAGGAYAQVAQQQAHTMGLVLTPEFAGGVYEPPTTRVDQVFELVLSPQFSGGEYKLVLVTFGPAPIALQLDPQFAGGTYIEVATQVSHEVRLVLNPQFSGGVYEEQPQA